MSAASPQSLSSRVLLAVSGAGIAPPCGAAAWLGLGPEFPSFWFPFLSPFLSPGSVFWWGLGSAWCASFGVLALLGLLRGGVARWLAFHLVVGAGVTVGAAAYHASSAGSGATIPPVIQTVAFNVDATVPLDPELVCEPSLHDSRVLVEHGSHPSFDGDQRAVWYEAPGPEGRIQIHRISLGDGDRVCWTCGEPGNNRRPSRNPKGQGLFFETDRHGAWDVHAISTELHKGAQPVSKRLTEAGSLDRFGLYDPTGKGLIWSHSGSGRFSIQVASLVTGHGGLILGSSRTLVAGGTAWVGPLAWAPDGRSLVYGLGIGPGVVQATLLDPGLGTERPLGPVTGPGSVSFSRDGQVMAVVQSEAAVPGPASLGFLLARIAVDAEERPGPAFLALGSPRGELVRVDLGELAAAGPPVGVSLAPKGRSLVLSQWVGDRSRLLYAARDCAAARL